MTIMGQGPALVGATPARKSSIASSQPPLISLADLLCPISVSLVHERDLLPLINLVRRISGGVAMIMATRANGMLASSRASRIMERQDVVGRSGLEPEAR
jgi:hypothetical protein